ncbi:MAG: hypothetical protein AAF086_08270 [Planctomycetota bacterium]
MVKLVGVDESEISAGFSIVEEQNIILIDGCVGRLAIVRASTKNSIFKIWFGYTIFSHVIVFRR